ncbi:YoaP domain-containing protein [Paenibacillus tarimensis]|nr:YoaP domain-containing protein [Paenibacillus tarimensis]
MSDKKAQQGVQLKKDWLACRFEEGLTFTKLDVRGKVFIEYLPAEKVWAPVDAPGFLYINCLWVAGSYKGQGHGKALLNEALRDSLGTNGLVTLTSATKRPYLADKKFLVSQGFEVCDTAPPYFELMIKRLDNRAPVPRFKECAKRLQLEGELARGLVVYYTNQCPFTDHYANAELEEIGKEFGIPVKRVRLTSREESQSAPAAWTTYSAFYDGNFLTHEMLTKGKLKSLLKNRQ